MAWARRKNDAERTAAAASLERAKGKASELLAGLRGSWLATHTPTSALTGLLPGATEQILRLEHCKGGRHQGTLGTQGSDPVSMLSWGHPGGIPQGIANLTVRAAPGSFHLVRQ